MEYFYTVEQILAAETQEVARYSDNALMKKAAYAVAQHTLTLMKKTAGRIYGTTALLLVGGGGNGGDALFAGTTLLRRGIQVHAIEFSPTKTHREGKAVFLAAGGEIIPQPKAAYTIAIDGISGLGAHGPLRKKATEIVSKLSCPILAIDIPTGVNPDTGQYDQKSVSAAVTVTFGAYKIAHILAAEKCGSIHLLDFGSHYHQILSNPTAISFTAFDHHLWPIPGPKDDKYSDGVCGIIAGSPTYPGAGILACGGGLAATSSMVRYIGDAHSEIVRIWPEIVASDNLAATGKVNSWVIGPGSGTKVIDYLNQLKDSQEPMLIDADGITALAHDPKLLTHLACTRPVLLTPHAGEFARLFSLDKSEVLLGDRLQLVKNAAIDIGATILLKGKNTIIAHPSGQLVIQRAPSSWAATPGSGDVLSGIIGALLASGLDTITAAGLGTWAHGQAAYYAAVQYKNLYGQQNPNIKPQSHNALPGGSPIRASKIIDALPYIIRDAQQKTHNYIPPR